MGFGIQNMRRLFLYATNGIINTVVTYGLFLLISRFTDYRISITISYIVGILLSYFLNSKIVFNSKGKFHIFILVNVCMLLINITITWFFIENFNMSKEYAQIVAIIVVFALGFTLNKRFSFSSYRNS